MMPIFEISWHMIKRRGEEGEGGGSGGGGGVAPLLKIERPIRRK